MKTISKTLTLGFLSVFVLSAGVAQACDGPRGGRHFDGPPPPFERMFEEADADKDGGLTEEEFSAFHSRKFSQIDTNSDGKITEAEIRAHHKAMRAEHRKHMKNERQDDDD